MTILLRLTSGWREATEPYLQALTVSYLYGHDYKLIFAKTQLINKLKAALFYSKII